MAQVKMAFVPLLPVPLLPVPILSDNVDVQQILQLRLTLTSIICIGAKLDEGDKHDGR